MTSPQRKPAATTAAVGKKPTIGESFKRYGLFNGTFIREAICQYRGLSQGAKLIYGRLGRYAGKDGAAYPSPGRLARELGIMGRQARAYLRELERKRFLKVDREHLHYDPSCAGDLKLWAI